MGVATFSNGWTFFKEPPLNFKTRIVCSILFDYTKGGASVQYKKIAPPKFKQADFKKKSL
jgi:hypothetical protein